MKQIWLVRHGQSRAQAQEVDDHVDSQLSDLGRRQARRLVEPLGAVRFDRVLVSPLRRAVGTFELCGAKAGQVECDSRVIETDWRPGYYENHRPAPTPSFAAADRHDAWLTPADERIGAVVDELIDGSGECMLIVAHWGIFSRLFAYFYGFPDMAGSFRMEMANAAISVLQQNDKGGRSVLYWNERGHVLDLLA